MLADSQPTFLLASNSPMLLAALEPVLLESGGRVEIVLSAEAALAAMTAPLVPEVVLLDVDLPGMESGDWLENIHANELSRRFSIVAVSDSVTPEWADRVARGAIDDLMPQSAEPAYWRLRLDLLQRSYHRTRSSKSCMKLPRRMRGPTRSRAFITGRLCLPCCFARLIGSSA